MESIVPTSKMSLKASCMRACKNDIKQATELYDFFVKDMTSLPDFDVVPPSTFEQIKTTIGDALSWLDANQEKLVGYYQMFQQFRGGGGAVVPSPPADVPPIPEQ